MVPMKLLFTLLLLYTLRPISADMDLDDLDDDSYTRIRGDNKQCPDRIRFRTERQTIPVNRIRTSEDDDCEGSAEIPLRAINSRRGSSESRPVQYLSSRIDDVERFYEGRNTAEFSCGPYTFPDNLQWIFFNPDDELDDVKWSSVYGRTPPFASEGEEVDFDDNERYLLIGDRCFYQDSSLIDKVCFPADATVQLENGVVKTMDNLNIGDRVHVGNGLYSDIFAWTHQTSKKKFKFVQLTTEHGYKISATPSHYIYADGQTMQMRHVRIGMSLKLEDGSASTIVDKERIIKTGLYNPQTTHGDLVVDGIIATTYTAAVQPETAHALLAPVRAAFQAVKPLLPGQSTEL